jgi:hypothetical protein
MYRPLIGLLLLIGLSHSSALSAHTRSESFSRWQYVGQTLSMRFTVSAREVTRIPYSQGSQDLTGLLLIYLDSHIVVQAREPGCKPSGPFKPLKAQAGFLQIEAIWHCAEPPAALGIHAFFDLAAEHSHFASFESPRGLSQRLITAEDQVWLLATASSGKNNSESNNSAFLDFVVHGFRHISSGLDHVVFLLALLLICRRTSEIVWAITGFTLGHSITLTLAVTGMVQPNVPTVEAIIGLTIALVAIERTANSMNSALPLALACALLLLLMAPLASLAGENLGVATLGGLALFSFCYLLAAHELNGQGSFRVLLTTLFGLVHGLGFAGAFLAANAGTDVLPWSLAGFNIGVELGQLALLAMLLTVGLLFRRQARLKAPASDLLSAVVCGCGVFWFVQRSFL